MSDSRKLLPYEHQLIDTLGITKEEYLAFVAQQHIYEDIKEGTVLDARNWEVVAIVLTVVGVLFQVASVLLAPKPTAPKVTAGGQPSTRDDIFAPRFSFNSAQQLASYGDPVNLVYCNTGSNPNGGVRTATSLIWSAVQSYGGSQLVQLLFAIGGGAIEEIDINRSAFGQIPLRDLIDQNYWIYFHPGGWGSLANSHLMPSPSTSSVTDPTFYGAPSDNPYRVRISDTGSKSDGFSHAYSPASSTSFGIYGVVPINIVYGVRNAQGYFEWAFNGIYSSPGWTRANSFEEAGAIRIIELKSINFVTGDANLEVNEARLTLSNVFDSSAVFKLGSAKYKITNINRGSVIDGDMIVNLVCIESGYLPTVAYSETNLNEVDVQAISASAIEYSQLKASVDNLLAQDRRVISQETGLIVDPNDYRFKYNSRTLTPQELLSKGDIVTLNAIKINVTGAQGYVYSKVRDLTSQEKSQIQRFIDLTNTRKAATNANNIFFTKALTRIEQASYETTSRCNLVDFSIKAKIFKRISGRQPEYGSERQAGWSVADNGIKRRSSMFIVKFKKVEDADYTYFPGIFVVSRAADIENFIYLRFDSGSRTEGDASNWQFIFEPISDPVAEILSNPGLIQSDGKRRFHYLENSGNPIRWQFTEYKNTPMWFEYKGIVSEGDNNGFPPINNNPGGLREWDLFSNTSDTQIQFSFDTGPEFGIAAVTEQIIESFSSFPGLYSNLSLIGLNMYSGKTIQDLRSFSVFVNRGRLTRGLRTDLGWGLDDLSYLSNQRNSYANTAPDIFIDTVIDGIDGIGKYASTYSVDIQQLAKSKKFCETNNFFMDCVIAEPSSWREFWATNAGFSLLELAKIGGRDTLVPAVPYDQNSGAISSNLAISALFNQGNILEDSYKEEFIDYGSNSQDVIVSVIYRNNNTGEAFAKNTTININLADTIEEYATRQTVDASNFVTTRNQAIAIGKLLCITKRYSRRAIEFKTFPTDSPVFPGAYIYVELAQNSWDRIYSGIVEEGGKLNTPISIPVGNYAALTYAHGTNNSENQPSGTQYFPSIEVQSSNGNTAPALASQAGSLFVLGVSVTRKRVFRVTEVTMDEEGEVTIRGVEHPTDNNGQSLIGELMLATSPEIWSIT